MRKKLKVNDLKIGKAYKSPIFSSGNTILIPANTPITKEDLSRLTKWGIEYVEIEEYDNKDDKKEKIIDQIKDKIEDVDKKKEEKIRKRNEMRATYRDMLNLLKEIMFDIQLDKLISKNNISELTEKVFDVCDTKKYEILNYLSNLTEKDQNYVYIHSLNVGIYSGILGISLGLNRYKLEHLLTGALLHDIGMFKIPNQIVNKQGKLTEKEFELIKQHTILGYKILNQKQGFPSDIALIALQHHERFNGTGYPRNLTGESISEFAKIVAIADSYDALTQTRSYRVKTHSHEAIKKVLSAASEFYDPEILTTFLSIMSIYPIGTIVQLNNGAIGVVIKSNPKFPLRPILKLLIDEFGEKSEEYTEIDLEENSNLFITQVIKAEELDIDLEDILY